MDKVREKFEAWSSDGGYTDALVKKDGVYIYFDTQISWEAYQAAHESQQAEIDRLREALEIARFALEPYDDEKPRDWITDRANIRKAHQTVKQALNNKGE